MPSENVEEHDSDDEKVELTKEEEAEALCEVANLLIEKKDHLDDTEIAEAMQDFEQALALDPKCIDAYLGKAYLLGLKEQYDEGFATLDRAKLEAPEDPRISEMLEELQNMKLHLHTSEEEDDEEEGDEDDEEDDEEEAETVSADIPLLVEKGVMTKRFFEVLSLIFHYYDKDKDGAWKTSELNEFYVAVNGENVDDTTINFIRGHFTTTSHGHLTLEGFLELYLSQTAGSAEETWKDLSKLGFDSNLKEVDNRYAHLLNKP